MASRTRRAADAPAALTTATCLWASGAAPAVDGSAPLNLTTFNPFKVLDVALHLTRHVALLPLDNGDIGPTETCR